MSEPPKKKVRCTQSQKEKLINHMAENRELALGTFTCPMGQQQQSEQWRRLAEMLSELGPSKSVEQWKTTWRDLRTKAKANNATVHRASRQTGNVSNVPVLSSADELVLSIIGKTTSQGMPDVPESGLVDSIPVSTMADPLCEPPESHVTQRDLPAGTLSSGDREPTASSVPTYSISRERQPVGEQASMPRVQYSRRQNLTEIYQDCSSATVDVLKDISNHLQERNRIEEERNKILQEKNNILHLMVQQQRSANQLGQQLEVLYEEDI